MTAMRAVLVSRMKKAPGVVPGASLACRPSRLHSGRGVEFQREVGDVGVQVRARAEVRRAYAHFPGAVAGVGGGVDVPGLGLTTLCDELRRTQVGAIRGDQLEVDRLIV